MPETVNPTFGQKLKSAFTDPKVIVVLLGMLASASGWGVSLLMEIGELRASQKMTEEQYINLKELHKTEITKMHNLVNDVISKCTIGVGK